MTKWEAHAKAHTLWHRRSGGTSAPGDRTGFTCLRRKGVPNRYEVGYHEILTFHPRETWITVVLGAGDSWEQAFERALQKGAP